jgi:hypothetical protein
VSRTTLVLLPGLDGTGDLFAPVVDALGPNVPTQIVRYPLSHASGYASCEPSRAARVKPTPTGRSPPPRKSASGCRIISGSSKRRPPVSWLEVHPENYMTGSAASAELELIANHYPLSLHAVGLSLGTADNITAQIVMTAGTTGRKEMPSFRQVPSEKELRDVATYVSRLLAK